MPSEERQTIRCLFFRQQLEVAKRALSVTCKFCHKSLKLDPISITTCGVVTVEKKGTVVADSILCGRIVVRGKVKARIESQGPVLIGRDAEVKGDVTAPVLAVGAGAVLEGQYDIGPKRVEPTAPEG